MGRRGPRGRPPRTFPPLDTSHRGPALCQPPPGWQGPGSLQTTRREVAAGPRIPPLHTCKSVILHPSLEHLQVLINALSEVCPGQGRSGEGQGLPQLQSVRRGHPEPPHPPLPPSPPELVLLLGAGVKFLSHLDALGRLAGLQASANLHVLSFFCFFFLESQ